jgi:phosphoribosylformylglycinamidine synthase subunit PurL
MQQLVREVIAEKLVVSAHDISEGGLFMNIIESAMVNGYGVDIEMKDDDMRMDALLFGEAQGRVIVTVKPKHQAAFEALCKKDIVPIELIGTVDDDAISINGIDFGKCKHYQTIYDSSLEKLINKN